MTGETLSGQLLFKKRYIFEGWLDEWDIVEPTHEDYEVWMVEALSDDRLDADHRSFLTRNRSTLAGIARGRLIEGAPHVPTREDRVRDRLRREGCVAFLAVERETSVPAGYVWAFVPSEDTVAAGIPIAAGTFFRFDAFTARSQRRRGVTTLVRGAATNWATERGCERYLSHIDASNELAKLAHVDDARSTPVGMNYLIQALGPPVLSVTNWMETPGITVNYLPAENEFT